MATLRPSARGRVLALGVLAILWACDREVPLEPPELRPGVDTCHACGMMITDLRFAAVRIVRADGDRRQVQRFDDLGCMAHDWAAHPGETVEAAYVREVSGEGWLEAEAAWYARSPSFVTPMLYGVAAFRSAEEVRDRLEAPPSWEGDLGALLSLASEGDLRPVPAAAGETP